jgi:RNA binding exosome subunit
MIQSDVASSDPYLAHVVAWRSVVFFGTEKHLKVCGILSHFLCNGHDDTTSHKTTASGGWGESHGTACQAQKNREGDKKLLHRLLYCSGIYSRVNRLKPRLNYNGNYGGDVVIDDGRV